MSNSQEEYKFLQMNIKKSFLLCFKSSSQDPLKGSGCQINIKVFLCGVGSNLCTAWPLHSELGHSRDYAILHTNIWVNA